MTTAAGPVTVDTIPIPSTDRRAFIVVGPGAGHPIDFLRADGSVLEHQPN